MGSIATLVIFSSGLIFTSGGLFVMLKTALRRLDQHDIRLAEFDTRFTNNEISHQAIITGQEYIIKMLDEDKARMIRIEEKLDKGA